MWASTRNITCWYHRCHHQDSWPAKATAAPPPPPLPPWQPASYPSPPTLELYQHCLPSARSATLQAWCRAGASVWCYSKVYRYEDSWHELHNSKHNEGCCEAAGYLKEPTCSKTKLGVSNDRAGMTTHWNNDCTNNAGQVLEIMYFTKHGYQLRIAFWQVFFLHWQSRNTRWPTLGFAEMGKRM